MRFQRFFPPGPSPDHLLETFDRRLEIRAHLATVRIDRVRRIGVARRIRNELEFCLFKMRFHRPSAKIAHAAGTKDIAQAQWPKSYRKTRSLGGCARETVRRGKLRTLT